MHSAEYFKNRDEQIAAQIEMLEDRLKGQLDEDFNTEKIIKSLLQGAPKPYLYSEYIDNLFGRDNDE